MFKNVESKLAKQMTLNKTNVNANSDDLVELKRELQTTKPREKRNPSVGLRTLNSSSNVKLPDINKYNKNNNPNNVKPQAKEGKEKPRKESAQKEAAEINKELKAEEENIQIFRHVPNTSLAKEEEVLMNIKKKLRGKGYQQPVSSGNVSNQKYNTNNEENIYSQQHNSHNANIDNNDNMDDLMRENELLQQRLNELNRQEELASASEISKVGKNVKNNSAKQG